MATRARKAAKPAKAPKRAKPARKPQSTSIQSARPKSRKPKSGERKADKPKSGAAKLKDLLRAAEDRQTATADILKVIASSPSDVQPVFDAIATSANRLIGGFSTAIHRVIDDINHLVAFTPTNPVSDEALKAAFPRHRSEVPPVALVENGETAQIADAETADAQTRKLGRARGWRSVTFTPLMSQGTLIGYIACTRREAGVLADHQVQLLRTFADQAVIAIENARLFDEVQARTRDLTESLEQQTATSEVLKVISSSPGELDPVFQTMLSNATRICQAKFGMMYRYDNGQFHPAALLNVPPALAEFVRDRGSFLPPPGTPLDRLFRTKEVTYTADETAESNPGAPARLGGARSLVGVPMLKENELIGAIIIYRQEVRPFTDKQVEGLDIRRQHNLAAYPRDLCSAMSPRAAASRLCSLVVFAIEFMQRIIS